ncbi:MAG: FKBP-type peptidyl-prolyl cis-trans isomerase, partial [Bacteroidales bacterium]|nr:FKBP-type peptidyl-prolyl cis-trans isomerase [Bacteroidales bacterium]
SFLNGLISLSEYGLFGDWLEGLAIFINKRVYNGRKSTSHGIDIEFEKDKVRYIVSIKSGPNWGNSSQIKKMISDFTAANRTFNKPCFPPSTLFFYLCQIRIRYMKKIAFIFVLLAVIGACNKDDEKSQDEIDYEIILNYIEQNDLDAIRHSTGIYYEITTEGSGSYPTINSSVVIKYKGYLTGGTVFDESTSSVELELPQLIPGFQVACQLLNIGGKGTFLIPSGLGYGESGKEDIPANAVLIFEIELIDFF